MTTYDAVAERYEQLTHRALGLRTRRRAAGIRRWFAQRRAARLRRSRRPTLTTLARPPGEALPPPMSGIPEQIAACASASGAA